MKSKRSFNSNSNEAYAFLSIGFEFIFVFLAFTGAGWFYDRYAPLDFLWNSPENSPKESSPRDSEKGSLGVLLGVFLGFSGGLWHLYRRIQELQASQVTKKPFRPLQLQEDISPPKQNIGPKPKKDNS